MGKRGPKKTPTRIKQLRGTHRRDRDGDPRAELRPTLLAELPPPRQNLAEVARQKWEATGNELIRLGLLTAHDLDALELYALCWQEVTDCDEVLQDEGEYLETKNDALRCHPAVARRAAALDRLRRMQAEFGMTPAARASMNVQTHRPAAVSNRRRDT